MSRLAHTGSPTLKHHTQTNGETDPDLLNSKGSPRDLVFRVIVGLILYPLGPVMAAVPALRRLLPRGLASRLAQMAQLRGPEAGTAAKPVVLSHLAVLIVGSALGYAETVWLLWYLPAWIGRFWLSLVFGWLPHHPHSETGRYRDTRIFTFIGSTFLIRGHDHHLLHHLFPVVPHYRLRALWVDMSHPLSRTGSSDRRSCCYHAQNHTDISITDGRHSDTTSCFHFSRQDGT